MEKSLGSVLADGEASANEGALKRARAAERQYQMALKRALDAVGSLGFLILFSPVLFGVALLVLCAQGRPVLFKHKRIGRNGQAFECFKFRTMTNDAERVLAEHLASSPLARREWEAAQKLKDDPRVTPLGEVLRKASLDELPQLINVLKGEMSLVGPRPIVESEAQFYGKYITYYQRLRPGLTGPWQVGGRSNTDYSKRVRLDVAYARNWSVGKDFLILLRTIPAVLKADGSI